MANTMTRLAPVAQHETPVLLRRWDGRRHPDVAPGLLLTRDEDRDRALLVPEQSLGIRGHQKPEVADDPHVVADERPVGVVDGLREPSRDQDHDPHEEGEDVQTEPDEPHHDAGRNHQHPPEEDSRPVQPRPGRDGDARRVPGHLIGAQGWKAVGEEEHIRIQTNAHAQERGHDPSDERRGTARDECSEPSDDDADQRRDTHEDDDDGSAHPI
jgi:hypothetical protein